MFTVEGCWYWLLMEGALLGFPALLFVLCFIACAVLIAAPGVFESTLIGLCESCIAYINMPRLSSYSNFDYPDGEEQIMPWVYWTDEERSLVIRQAYKDLTLTSKEVKPYLDASRQHFYAQWIVPLAVAGICFGPLRATLLSSAYRKHPSLGFRNSAGLTGGFTLFWLNLSPFYIAKQNEQVRTLKTIWTKIGANIKVYNDLVAKSTTSTSLDKDTWRVYENRNSAGWLTGPEDEDSAPYFLPDTRASTRIKKIFL